MQLIKGELRFDFLGQRHISLTVSTVLIVAGLVAYVALGGFNYGIDFSGGTLVQVRLEETDEINRIREALSAGGLPSFQLQAFGEEEAHEYLVTLGQSLTLADGATQSAAAAVERILTARFPSVTIRRVETVGPKVGEELKWAATQAVVFALVAILVYVWVRFQWRYSIGALVALAHDVLIVLAAFVITQKQISLPVVAAVLTVAGYSINDTIVIFDRIRENLRKYQKKDTLEVFNESVNQTLSRTILTSGTTLFVVLSIFLFGGEIINDFAFALLIGVIVGTYSSVFVAAPMVFILLRRFPPPIK